MKKITVLFIFIPFLIFSQQKDSILKQTFTYKDTLKLDLYHLQKKADPKTPLLVLIHGGGFSGGKRDHPIETEFCKNMVEKGFTVASMSYRLTRKGKGFGCDSPASEKVETFVKAAEDISATLNFLEKKGFSPKNRPVILIGSSAGAEAALNYAFMLDDYRFKHIAKIPVSGVISFSGAMLNTDYITRENTVPVLFFHGEKDKLVPFGTAAHHYCKSDKTGYLILEGPQTISKKLKELNTAYLLAFDPEGTHNWSSKAFKKTTMISDFINKAILKHELIQTTQKLR